MQWKKKFGRIQRELLQKDQVKVCSRYQYGEDTRGFSRKKRLDHLGEKKKKKLIEAKIRESKM